jgi:hypothetical protein
VEKNWDTLPIFPIERRKVLETKVYLVVCGLVRVEIILQKSFESSKVL